MALSHLNLDYSKPLTFPGKAFSTFMGSKQPGSNADEEFLWGIAVEVKRKIGKVLFHLFIILLLLLLLYITIALIDEQRLGTNKKLPGSTFIQVFPSSPSRKRARHGEVKDKLPSASEWKHDNMYAVQMYYVPTNFAANVIPVSFMPSKAGIVWLGSYLQSSPHL